VAGDRRACRALVFAAMFAMATAFKLAGIGATAGYIASAGFPFPLFLAWCAAIFELALFVALLTGAFFSEAALLAAVYVVFLGFAFHGPSHWGAEQIGQLEFGAFMSHFPFAAGLLFAAAYGPGAWALRWGVLGRR
jgi:putative oxidoreductase